MIGAEHRLHAHWPGRQPSKSNKACVWRPTIFSMRVFLVLASVHLSRMQTDWREPARATTLASLGISVVFVCVEFGHTANPDQPSVSPSALQSTQTS